MNNPTYRCPRCRKTDTLDVTISCTARLVQEPDGNIQTDTDLVFDGSHYWDEDSPVKCSFCGKMGKVEDFRL